MFDGACVRVPLPDGSLLPADNDSADRFDDVSGERHATPLDVLGVINQVLGR